MNGTGNESTHIAEKVSDERKQASLKVEMLRNEIALATPEWHSTRDFLLFLTLDQRIHFCQRYRSKSSRVRSREFMEVLRTRMIGADLSLEYFPVLYGYQLFRKIKEPRPIGPKSAY